MENNNYKSIKKLEKIIQDLKTDLQTLKEDTGKFANVTSEQIKKEIVNNKNEIINNKNLIVILISLGISIPYVIFWSKSFWSFHDNYSIIENLGIYLFLITTPIISVGITFFIMYILLLKFFPNILKAFNFIIKSIKKR